MSSFAQDYLQAGVDPEVLHRVATIASGGLDSLPHCGAVITMFTGLQRRGCPERCTPKWNRYLETHKEVDKCNDTRYITEVIRTFKNRALKKLYEKGDPSKINADHIDRVEDILFRLDNAVKPSDMDWPGWKLHPLKGKHKGFWAVWVSGNYRIWYRFEDGDTFDVDYGDYH